jgi:2-keto-3-deoxy-L-rhamnonate aldolase RhmA
MMADVFVRSTNGPDAGAASVTIPFVQTAGLARACHGATSFLRSSSDGVMSTLPRSTRNRHVNRYTLDERTWIACLLRRVEMRKK